MLSVREFLVILLLFRFSTAEDESLPGAVSNITPIMTLEPVTELDTNAESSSDPEPKGDPEPDAKPDGNEAGLLPEFVDLSDLICNVCNCTEKVVDCSHRDLRSPFEEDDWKGVQRLGVQDVTNVDLSSNHFVAVPQFPTLPIRRLNLSNCEIEIIKDAAFSNLKYLSVLDLSRNKLSFVIGKRAFYGVYEEGKKPMPFMYLQHLNLAYNDIHSLSSDVFTFMPHLTFLDLSGNSLVSIDQVTMGALVDLMRLRELRISECDLEYLPTGIFRRLRRLQRLDLGGNRFAVVPRPLSEAINLQYLNFNRNPVEAISERTAISNLTKLQELHLSRLSKLRSIAHGGLGGLENLVILHMRFNPRLTVLHPKFLEWEDELGVEKWPVLKEFYLNNNNISSIDSRFLERWDHLTHVDFTANPYVCDCNSQWMVNVLVPLMMGLVTNASTARMICRRPYNYRGLTFAQLFESQTTLECPVTEAVTEDISMETAVMYGVLIGILIAFPLVMVVVILWKKGYFARCRKKMISKKDYYEDEETDAF